MSGNGRAETPAGSWGVGNLENLDTDGAGGFYVTGLHFCADHTLANGIPLQRLDTVADNPVLCTYTHPRLRRGPPNRTPPRFHGTSHVVLMEKPVRMH